MLGIRLILLSVVLAGCNSAATTPSAVPTASVAPTASAAPTVSAAASSTTATPASSPSDSPGASAACIDAGQSGDLGESVVVALQGVDTALKAKDAAQARAAATTALAALGKFADLVGPVEPDAAKEIRTAMADLAKAMAQFPAGLALVTQAEAEWDKGLQDSRVGDCLS
jgi:hypothetical protein